MAKKQVIIDTDCGIDDAQAIMMALAAPNIQILGVTCVFGNTAIENVCQNVLRVLSICESEGVRILKLHLNDQMNNFIPEQMDCKVVSFLSHSYFFYYFLFFLHSVVLERILYNKIDFSTSCPT